MTDADPDVDRFVVAIRSGDVATVQRLVDERPAWASPLLGGSPGGRTPLHVVLWACSPRLEELLATQDGSEPEGVSQAFWHACAGGQRRSAEYLLGRGADLHWVPDYSSGTPLDAASGLGTRQENVISWLRSRGARSEDDP